MINIYGYSYYDYVKDLRLSDLTRKKEFKLKKEQKQILQKKQFIRPSKKYNNQNKKMLTYISRQH